MPTLKIPKGVDQSVSFQENSHRMMMGQGRGARNLSEINAHGQRVPEELKFNMVPKERGRIGPSHGMASPRGMQITDK